MLKIEPENPVLCVERVLFHLGTETQQTQDCYQKGIDRSDVCGHIPSPPTKRRNFEIHFMACTNKLKTKIITEYN